MNILRSLYSKIRGVSSSSLNGTMSKLVFSLTQKPTLKKDKLPVSKKFPNGEKGGLIISADFEMAWAWRYTKTGSNHIKKGQIERMNFPAIINILEQYDVPITFATVGHLFLEQCQKSDHDWMSRIPHFDDHWKFTKGDWYDHDPYSGVKDAPEWYAPDLVQMILDSKTKHEVGSHTFSHIDFSYKNCPAEVADDEIIACIKAADPFNIDLKSMVFPGGTWGNIEVLKKHDFVIYRKRDEFELAYPYRDKFGLLVSPSSGCLEYNLKYGWTPDYFVKRLKKYVDKALKTNTVAHLWFHPSLNPYFLENIFPPFLAYAAQQREKGDLWIGTMKTIAEHINRNKIV